jgi:hypothetical protein
MGWWRKGKLRDRKKGVRRDETAKASLTEQLEDVTFRDRSDHGLHGHFSGAMTGTSNGTVVHHTNHQIKIKILS